MPQAIASFPGLTNISQWDITLPRGVRPGSIIVEFTPQPVTYTQAGSFEVSYGGVPVISMPGAVLDQASLVKVGPYRWRARILDRRAHWQHTLVSIRANVRGKDGAITTAATPQAIAASILTQMGETNFDVSRMPGGSPYIEHHQRRGDLVLAELCRRTDCVPLIAASGNVEIWPRGTGNAIPTAFRQNPLTRIVRGVGPDAVQVIGGDVVYQARFKLKAVAEEEDGSLVDYTSASYTPASGWGPEWPWFFSGVAENTRRLAFRSVFRYYQVESFANGTLALPDYGTGGYTLTNITQCQLLPYRLNGATARMLGNFWTGQLFNSNYAAANYDGVWFLDAARQLVVCAEPVFQQTGSTATTEPADLYLETAFTVIENDSKRRQFTQNRTLGNGVGTRVIQYPELLVSAKQEYSAITTRGSVTSNYSTVSTAATYVLDGAATRAANRDIEHYIAAGIRPLGLDGIRMQATWRGGIDRPPTTELITNSECVFGTSEFREELATLAEASHDLG